MIKKKLKWNKPKLIVLIRSCQEEIVLSRCKGGSISTSMGGIYGACKWSFDLGICLKCNSTGSS